MRLSVATMAMILSVPLLSPARGQALPSSAKVDTEPLELLPVDRFVIPSLLVPIRRVTIVAPSDGVVRSQDAKAGAQVREGQDVALIDRGEAGARLKIAQAEVKKAQAELDIANIKTKAAGELTTPGGQAYVAQAQAVLDMAQARTELAQIAFDQCALRAPFAGKVLDSKVSDGQYVTKGTVIAELADVSSLRALVPVARTGVTAGGALTLNVEGQPVSGKIQALLPLPETLSVLRELASPLAAAWVVLPNTNGTLEPGQRALSPALPSAPIATIPAIALQKPDVKEKDPSSSVLVIRNEYVTRVKVRVLGNPVPERAQVTGLLRPTDALIVSSSVPLLAGTLVRFNGSTESTVEATNPSPAESGATADLTPSRPTRTAPIGAPGSALPRSKSSTKAATAPASQPAPKPASAASVPF